MNVQTIDIREKNEEINFPYKDKHYIMNVLTSEGKVAFSFEMALDLMQLMHDTLENALSIINRNMSVNNQN
jgi:hypothetical protein